MTDTSDQDDHPRQYGGAALWVAIWAIVISLGCIYFAISAKNAAQAAERRLERNVQLLDESRNQIADLDKQVRERITFTEQRLEEMSFSIEKNESRSVGMEKQLESTREVLARMIDALANQREVIGSLSKKIDANQGSIRRSGTEPSPSNATPNNVSGSASSGENATASDGGENASSTGSSASSNSGANATEPTSTQPGEYKVERGDTLSEIARRHGLSVPELLDANPSIDPNIIKVGQVLRLPQ